MKANPPSEIAKGLIEIDVSIAQLKERRKDAAAKVRIQERKLSNSKCYLVGRSVQAWAAGDPKRLQWLNEVLDNTLTKDGERQVAGLARKQIGIAPAVNQPRESNSAV